jgi:plasmid stabilization system protein ParE
MRKIELSPEAADDILGIWDYIARSKLPARIESETNSTTRS